MKPLYRTLIERAPSGKYRWRLVDFLEQPLQTGTCMSRREAEARAIAAKRALPRSEGTRTHMGTIEHTGRRCHMPRFVVRSAGFSPSKNATTSNGLPTA